MNTESPSQPTEAVKPKRSSPLRTVVLLALLAVAAFMYFTKDTGFSLSGKPTETAAQKIVEGRIASQSKGSITLVGLKKINAA